MAQNHINYLSRDFDSIKADIIAYAKQSYPQLSDNFGNDTSVSSFIVDALADCVDNLNYHIDRTFQDTQLSSTNSRQALLNIARSNGLKVPGPKAGMCEVQFSCILPPGDGSDNSKPKWGVAPVIQRNCVVGTGNLSYTIDENVDFREQFNYNGFSNRSYSPLRNSNGEITAYTVTKSVVATAGQRKIYKKVLSEGDVRPFMEVMLPDVDILNVDSVIFKSSQNLTVTPEISEFYVDKEQYNFKEGAVTTYRYFETNSLIDQWRWAPELDDAKFHDGIVYDKYNPEAYDDLDVDGMPLTRTYIGDWKPLRQKFITERTNNGYMKLIFGPGVEYTPIPDDGTNYTKYRMASIMNNDMLGVLPKIGWTMYVLYNIGGGIETNVANGAITTIKSMQVDFPSMSQQLTNEDRNIRSSILKTISVKNTTPSIAGKNAPTTEELRYMIMYNTASQDRCVSVKDYQTRLMMMPPKYGAPFRCAAIEENNKIVISMLGLNSSGNLTKILPNTLVDNIEKYLSHYKTIGDYVELKSGKIYNLGFLIDAFIDKAYNAADVVSSIIRTVKDYMDVNKHNMGEDIFIGDLYKEISQLDGVIGLIDLNIYKLTDGPYSSDNCPLPSTDETRYGECNTVLDTQFLVEDGATAKRIDIDEIDSVLLCECNSMYEIKNPNVDIRVRIKQR